MKMTEKFMHWAVTQDETWVHHWSWGKKAEYAMEAPWLIQGILREFLLQERWWPLSFGIVRVLSGWIILKVAQ